MENHFLDVFTRYSNKILKTFYGEFAFHVEWFAFWKPCVLRLSRFGQCLEFLIEWESPSKAYKPFYYIDTCVLLETRPLVKFIRNHIRDSSGVFSISSLVRISMLSLISSFSLKLYLISLVYDRNIFGSSSKMFGNLR